MSKLSTRRNTNRIPQHNYSIPGQYFVTICTNNRECIFGDIKENEMFLNQCGEIVNDLWLKIPKHFENIELDTYVIMPNHMHCIINIPNIVGAIHESPDNECKLSDNKYKIPDNKIQKYNKIINHTDNSIRAIRELPLQNNRRNMGLSKIIGYIKRKRV